MDIIINGEKYYDTPISRMLNYDIFHSYVMYISNKYSTRVTPHTHKSMTYWGDDVIRKINKYYIHTLIFNQFGENVEIRFYNNRITGVSHSIKMFISKKEDHITDIVSLVAIFKIIDDLFPFVNIHYITMENVNIHHNTKDVTKSRKLCLNKKFKAIVETYIKQKE